MMHHCDGRGKAGVRVACRTGSRRIIWSVWICVARILHVRRPVRHPIGRLARKRRMFWVLLEVTINSAKCNGWLSSSPWSGVLQSLPAVLHHAGPELRGADPPREVVVAMSMHNYRQCIRKMNDSRRRDDLAGPLISSFSNLFFDHCRCVRNIVDIHLRLFGRACDVVIESICQKPEIRYSYAWCICKYCAERVLKEILITESQYVFSSSSLHPSILKSHRPSETIIIHLAYTRARVIDFELPDIWKFMDSICPKIQLALSWISESPRARSWDWDPRVWHFSSR